jgi:hypothetical protein
MDRTGRKHQLMAYEHDTPGNLVGVIGERSPAGQLDEVHSDQACGPYLPPV